MTRVAELSICSNISILNFSEFDFDSDESVRKLADVLAIAPVLKECNISYQESNRKIYVEVNYSNEESMGAIVIFDTSTNQEIYRRETYKQEALNQM